MRLVILNTILAALEADLAAFGNPDLSHRLLHDGLPPLFLANELTAQLQTTALRYWRDKQGHEVDFIWLPRGQTPLAIECKWSARDFDPASLLVFARAYPKPDLLVVTTDARPAFVRQYDGRRVHFLTLDRLVDRITA